MDESLTGSLRQRSGRKGRSMIAPTNFKDLSDEELLKKLKENYSDKAAVYVLKVLRGKIKPSYPLE